MATIVFKTKDNLVCVETNKTPPEGKIKLIRPLNNESRSGMYLGEELLPDTPSINMTGNMNQTFAYREYLLTSRVRDIYFFEEQ